MTEIVKRIIFRYIQKTFDGLDPDSIKIDDVRTISEQVMCRNYKALAICNGLDGYIFRVSHNNGATDWFVEEYVKGRITACNEVGENMKGICDCNVCAFVDRDADEYPCRVCCANESSGSSENKYEMFSPKERTDSPQIASYLGESEVSTKVSATPVVDKPSTPDMVNHPAHYTNGGIECIDAIDSMLSGYEQPSYAYYAGQVLKYLWRAPLKGKLLQDLQKAKWYLLRMIDRIADDVWEADNARGD